MYSTYLSLKKKIKQFPNNCLALRMYSCLASEIHYNLILFSSCTRALHTAARSACNSLHFLSASLSCNGWAVYIHMPPRCCYNGMRCTCVWCMWYSLQCISCWCCVYSLCLQEIEEAKADLGARGVDVS